ncbi:FAD-binding protein [Paenibacillus arenilitoris]|uniref:FAD-binding protein n=1 Tax=Paenibacillus arenilitoris TaxID=2772299 RepID=A0A927H3W4_9BACL|nr:FAD-binding protein [Paenibacillus arenilitoris]MBD2867290.1 FAD-binding protein [Paenibacillus arenilitoris]
MENERNWAGNYAYNAAEFHAPDTMEELREKVARGSRVKVLGSRHSFNGIADTTATHLSLHKLNRVVDLDRTNRRVTVEGGIRYGELCRYLHDNGYALHNLASLPHITVAGACATATHGSGDRNGSLSTAVYALELVKADGETAVFTRGQDGDFAGAVVGLGALGVVTKLTLDVVPAFEMSQRVYENLPLSRLRDNLDAVFSSAYSVSLFSDWKESAFNQVWVKRRTDDPKAAQPESPFFAAVPAAEHRHPVPGLGADNCSRQLGVPGPWYERMPHFRMDFTPSAGEELQSEYFVRREDAYEALCEIDRLKERIAPLLYVSEVRTIAADDHWMSPCYKQDSVAFHFTWKADGEAVRQLLPLIEERMAPFDARPHWSKLFAMAPARLQSLYEKLPAFRQLIKRCDPQGKFRNDYLDTYILGNA